MFSDQKTHPKHKNKINIEGINYYHACAKRNSYKWKNDPKWNHGNIRAIEEHWKVLHVKYK